MVILGIILILIDALFAHTGILLYLGIALVIIGLILNFVPLGGTRRRFY